MTTFSVWQFGDDEGASKAEAALVHAAEEGLVTIVDHVVVSWPADAEQPELSNTRSAAERGAAKGALWGILGGVLLTVPVAGAVVGAGLGAVAKATANTGITKQDLERIRTEVTPGTSALCAVTEGEELDRLRERFRGHDSPVVSSKLTEAERDALLEMFGVAEQATTGTNPLGLVRGSEGTITGTVVCGAAIAVGAAHSETTVHLSLVILATVGVYWLAHLHAVTIGSTLTKRHHPVVAFRHALRETLPIAGASVVPLGVLILATWVGLDLSAAARTALYATIGLLAVYGYVAGARSGLDLSARVVSAVLGAAVGVLVVLLKVWLH